MDVLGLSAAPSRPSGTPTSSAMGHHAHSSPGQDGQQEVSTNARPSPSPLQEPQSSNQKTSSSKSKSNPHRRSFLHLSTKMSNKLSRNPAGHHSSANLASPSSTQFSSPRYAQPATFLDPSAGLLPPPPIRNYDGVYRTGHGSAPSSPIQRPLHTNLSVPDLTKPVPSSPTDHKKKRKSWFSGFKSSSKDHDTTPPAWILGRRDTAYDVKALINAQRVPELWDEQGDTLVHLFPATARKGPSFRIQSSLYAASKTLSALAHGSAHSIGAESTPGSDYRAVSGRHGPFQGSIATPPLTPEQRPVSRDAYGRPGSFDLASPHEIHLYLPLSLSTDSVIDMAKESAAKLTPRDIQTLVQARNLFSFLVGGSLVSTESCSSAFQIFMDLSAMLERYDFSNMDGSTFGDMAANSFDRYVMELGLADVRASREKTLQGLVLGEHMRSQLLYNEAFVHAVGKYEDITESKSNLFNRVSPLTRTRLERASLDLNSRINTLDRKLENFDFPAIFSGIMNSKTADERKEVNFAAWREAFMAMRKHTLGFYKDRFGAWPPKASSKKNELETSGLNRAVVRELYADLTSLYDILVDRQNLSNRTIGAPVGEQEGTGDAEQRVVRRVLDEYDRSTPPVQPPMPFDVPRLPTLAVTRPDYGRDAHKDAKARNKKLNKKDELSRILHASYNAASGPDTPFITAYREAEYQFSKHNTINNIRSYRVGTWIFLYAVLQSLPMLVVDAPNLHYTQGVEYFLCVPPRSGVPWAARNDDRTVSRSWYGVPGAQNTVVSMPSDVLEFGVEGVYMRSHCWVMAKKWAEEGGLVPTRSAESASTASSGAASGLAMIEPATSFPNAPAIAAPQPLSKPHPNVISQETLRNVTPHRVPVGSRTLLDPGHSETTSMSGASSHHSVISLGLEELPLSADLPVTKAPTAGVGRGHRGRKVVEVDPAKTFDAIIGDMEKEKGGKKGKKK